MYIFYQDKNKFLAIYVKPEIVFRLFLIYQFQTKTANTSNRQQQVFINSRVPNIFEQSHAIRLLSCFEKSFEQWHALSISLFSKVFIFQETKICGLFLCSKYPLNVAFLYLVIAVFYKTKMEGTFCIQTGVIESLILLQSGFKLM